MDTSILEELGLTPSEIAAYVALLELGSAHAGAIAERSGLPNSVLHRALNQLIAKGLINSVQEGRIRVYQATKPEHFFTFLDEKRRRFSELLPQLKQRQAASAKAETATVYKGVRGVTEVYNQLFSEPGKEYNSFGGGRQCADRMGMAWWMNIHAKRVERRLPSRQVFDESVRRLSKDITKRPLTQARFLPAEFASFQETVIVGDLVAITVFTEHPYSFLMRDKTVAQSYKQYFELLWSMAKR